MGDQVWYRNISLLNNFECPIEIDNNEYALLYDFYLEFLSFPGISMKKTVQRHDKDQYIQEIASVSSRHN